MQFHAAINSLLQYWYKNSVCKVAFISFIEEPDSELLLVKALLWDCINVASCHDLRRLESPSSADLLMQGNWPIHQRQQKSELQSHKCIKNGSADMGDKEEDVVKSWMGQCQEKLRLK